jgi:hypothetical protein
MAPACASGYVQRTFADMEEPLTNPEKQATARLP